MALSAPRRRLKREIALVLVAKLLALLAIWSLWFAYPESSQLDPGRVRDALYASRAAVQPGAARDAQP